MERSLITVWLRKKAAYDAALVNAAYEAFLSEHTKQREEGAQQEVEGVWEQFKGPSSAASGKTGVKL